MGTVTGSVTLHPSGYIGASNWSIPTSGSYSITNAYKGTGDTSSSCRISVNTSATGYVYLIFDTSDIPDGATITSITGKVQVRVSNTTRVTSTKCQLYTGTTAKGSNVTFASTSTSNVVTLSPGTGWTRANLDDLRLFIGATGSSSSQTKYVYLYGADITINYSVTAYDITINNSTSATVTASESEVAAGSSVRIHTNTVSGLTFKDNGTDVTAQFGSPSPESTSATADDFTTQLSASGANFYTSSSSTGNYFNYAVGHTAESPGHTTASATYVKDNGNNTATGWAIYSFDFSAIPAGATINSVTVKCYGFCENTTHDSTHKANIKLYSGSTQKGTEQYFTSTSNQTITISSPGTWTRDELQNAKLHFEVAYYGGGIFGITWTVSYTESGYEYIISNVAANHTITVTSGGTTTILYYKNNDSWAAATRVYKKISGSWVQQNDLTTVFDGNTNYVKG